MRRSNLANRKILASNGSNLRETGRAFQLPLTTGLADDLPDVIGPKFGLNGPSTGRSTRSAMSR
jgi:hypothetical protein